MPRKSIKFLAIVVSLFMLAVVVSGCGGSSGSGGKSSAKTLADYTPEKPLVLKWTDVAAVNTPKVQGAQKFAEQVTKNSGGKIKIEVYANSQLYNEKEEQEAMLAGNVHFINPSSTKMVTFNPAYQYVDMPMLFKDEAHAKKVYESKVLDPMYKSLESKNIQVLGMFMTGFKQFSTSAHPLKKPEDFKGLKFRVQAGKVNDAVFKSLGAGSATIPFGETYTALQQGTVDSQENTFNNFDTQSYAEVQKHLTISNHGRLDHIVLTKKDWWDGLSPDIRDVLKKSIDEAVRYEWGVCEKMQDDSRKNIEKTGKVQMYKLTDEERQVLIKTFEPVYKEFSKVIGEDVIKGIKDLEK